MCVCVWVVHAPRHKRSRVAKQDGESPNRATKSRQSRPETERESTIERQMERKPKRKETRREKEKERSDGENARRQLSLSRSQALSAERARVARE